MDGSLDLLCGIPGGGDDGGRVGSGGSISIMRNDEQSNHSNHHMGCDDDGCGLEVGLGLSIGSGLKTKEEGSCSSSSSSSSFVNIPNSPIVGTNRAPVDSVSPPNATSLVGWPPITRANRNPIVAHRIKPEHDDFISRPVNNNRINGNGYLSVKVNMDGTLIGRKVNLNAHISYETLSQTLENMFHGSRKQAKIADFGVSRILAQTMDPCNSSVGTISYMSRERINTGDIWLAKGHNLYIILRTRTEKTKVPLTLGLLTDLFDGRLE